MQNGEVVWGLRGKTMAHNDIEQKRQSLIDIQKEEDARVRLERLQALAKETGASTTRMASTTSRSGIVSSVRVSNEITETEIVQNINDALQTASMVNMCKTATRNFIITLVVAIAALLSALAAWLAILSSRGRQ